MAIAPQPYNLALFTDRDEQRQVITKYLQSLLDGVGHMRSGVLNFYGVCGVGKSLLREKGVADFRTALQKDIYESCPFAIAVVDLDSDSSLLNSPIPVILGRARTALAEAGISTPLFDYLYTLWWKAEHPGQLINLGGPPSNGTGLLDVVVTLKSLASHLEFDLPLVGVVTDLNKLFTRANGLFQRSLVKKLFKREGIPEHWQNHLRIERMPVMLAYDLLSAIKHTPQTSICLVIDGFDQVQSKWLKTDAQWALATLVAEVLSNTETFSAHDDRLLRGRIGFMIFGRERLRWDKLFKRERVRLSWKQQIEQHSELLGLLENDARRFLGEAAAWERDHEQLEKVAALIEQHTYAILQAAAERRPESTSSYLPYYLGLAVRLIRDHADDFKPDMLGEMPSELERRFLQYLDQQHRCALQALSLALTFDRTLFDFLHIEGYTANYAGPVFDGLVGDHWSFTYLVEGRPGFHRFHHHMQMSLIASVCMLPEDIKRAQEIIDKLLDRLTEKMKVGHSDDLGPEQESAYLDAMALLREHQENGLLDALTAIERAQAIDAFFVSGLS